MQSESVSPYRTAFAGMIAMAVAMGIGRFVYTPILPGMMDELGMSASDAGLLASANYLGYLAGAIVAAGGWARGRERLVVLASIAASAVLAGAMGLTARLDLFIAIRIAAGVVSAFVLVYQSSIVFARLVEAGRSDLQAIHFGGVGLGIALSALMTGWLHLEGAGWQASWFWAGAISAAGFLAVLAIDSSAPPRVGPAPRESALPRDPALYRLILAYGVFGFGYIVTATFLVAIVRQGGSGGLLESGVWLATGLAGLPSVWLWAIAARRFGMVAAVAWGCVVEGIGIIASVALGGTVGPMLGGILFGGTFIAITAFGLRFGRDLAGGAPRKTLALMTAAFGIGQIIGPIAAGYLADLTGGFFLPSAGAAVALLLSAIITLDSGRRAAAR